MKQFQPDKRLNSHHHHHSHNHHHPRRSLLRATLLWLCGVLVLASCGGASGATPVATPPPAAVPSAPPTAATPDIAAAPTAPPPSISASDPARMPHPRLLLDGRTPAQLREQATTTHAAIWQPIEAFVASRSEQVPPASPPADAVMSDYRTFGNQLIAYAFVCLVTEADAPCALARATLLTYAGWQQWDVAEYRDLGHAHMLQANALAYDWLYPRLSADEQATVRASLAQRAAQLYAAATSPYTPEWNNWWVTSPMQNHYMIKHAALGTAALALLDESPDAVRWLELAQQRLAVQTTLLEGIADGTWHEGISYQHYGLTQMLPFLVNLRALRGIDLIPHTYLQRYGQWRVYNHMPQSLRFIIAAGDFEWDWIATGLATNLLRYVAASYGDGTAEWLVQQMEQQPGRSANEFQTPWYVYEFLYYNPAVPASDPATLPLAQTFPDLAAVIWRTGWQPDDLVFGFKAGVYGGTYAFTGFTTGAPPWTPPCQPLDCQLNIGHDHLDTNSFYLARGRTWLVPEDVGNGQWETSYHNTLLIDGQGQYRPDPQQFNRNPDLFVDSAGSLLVSHDSPALSYLAADATRRYRQIEGLERVVRHVLFVRPGYFLIVDDLAAASPREYTWIAHADSGQAIEPQPDGWVRSTAEDGQVLGVLPLAPANATIEVGAADLPFMHIWPATPAASERLVHMLYPTTAAAWDARPQVRLLPDTGSGLGVDVQPADGSRDVVLLRYADPTTSASAMQQVGGLSFDGQVALLRYASDGSLQELALLGGTRLAAGDDLFIELPQPLDGGMQVRYAGDVLDLAGAAPLPAGTRIFAPAVAEVRENGVPRAFTSTGTWIELQ